MAGGLVLPPEHPLELAAIAVTGAPGQEVLSGCAARGLEQRTCRLEPPALHPIADDLQGGVCLVHHHAHGMQRGDGDASLLHPSDHALPAHQGERVHVLVVHHPYELLASFRTDVGESGLAAHRADEPAIRDHDHAVSRGDLHQGHACRVSRSGAHRYTAVWFDPGADRHEPEEPPVLDLVARGQRLVGGVHGDPESGHARRPVPRERHPGVRLVQMVDECLDRAHEHPPGFEVPYTMTQPGHSLVGIRS